MFIEKKAVRTSSGKNMLQKFVKVYSDYRPISCALSLFRNSCPTRR